MGQTTRATSPPRGLLVRSLWVAAQKINKACPKVFSTPPVVPYFEAKVAASKELPSSSLPYSHFKTNTAALAYPSGRSVDGRGGAAAATVAAAEVDAGREAGRTEVKAGEGREKKADGPDDDVAARVHKWSREEAKEAKDSARQGEAAAALIAETEEHTRIQRKPTAATAKKPREAGQCTDKVASRGEWELLGEEAGRRCGAQAADIRELVTPTGRDVAILSAEQLQKEAAEATIELSAEAEEESAGGTLQEGTDALVRGANGYEGARSCASFRNPLAADNTGATPVAQDRVPQAVQQFNTAAHEEVAQGFFLPLKRIVYAYLCELRMLMSCRVEELSHLYPSVHLLQKEQQQLQLTPSAHTKLLCPITAATRRTRCGSTSPFGPSSTNISRASPDQPACLPEDSVSSSSGDALLATVVGVGLATKDCSVCAAAPWEPFTLHIANTLEAENVDELLPYVEIFEPCLHAGLSPACLSPQACALLSVALRYVKNSGFLVSVYRRQRKRVEDCAVSADVLTAKPAPGLCTSGTRNTTTALTAPARTAASSAVVSLDEDQLKRYNVPHATNEGVLPRSSGGRQTMSLDRPGIHACDEWHDFVFKTGRGAISKTDTVNMQLRSYEGDAISSTTSDSLSVIFSASTGKKPSSKTSSEVDACVVAGSAERNSCTCGRASSSGEDTLHTRAKTRATVTVRNPPITGNCSACYRDAMNRMLHFAFSSHSKWVGEKGNTDNCVQKRDEYCSAAAFQLKHQNDGHSYENMLRGRHGRNRRHLKKRPAELVVTGSVYKEEGRRNGGVPFQYDAAFFRFEGIDDPQLAKGLDRAKLVCLEHLHWLRQLVPSWSGKPYQQHAEAILGARSVSELTNYLIVFSSLQPDVTNQFPVTTASLRQVPSFVSATPFSQECLEELQILQSGYAFSALSSGLLRPRPSSTTPDAFPLRTCHRSTSDVVFSSRSSVSNFPFTPTATSTDSNATSGTSAVLLPSNSTAGCTGTSRWGCTSSTIKCDKVLLPVSEQEIANGLLAYSCRECRMPISDSQCRGAPTAESLLQSGAAVTCSSSTPRLKSRSGVATSAVSQCPEPIRSPDHPNHESTDVVRWRLYEKEVEASLQRIVLKGDSWLLQPSHANRRFADVDRNCWGVTCNAGSSQCCVKTDCHDSCLTPWRRTSDNRPAGEDPDLRMHCDDPRSGGGACSSSTSCGNSRCGADENDVSGEDDSTGDDANSKQFRPENSRENTAENSLGDSRAEHASRSSVNSSGNMNAFPSFSLEGAPADAAVSTLALGGALGAAERVPRKLLLPPLDPSSPPLHLLLRNGPPDWSSSRHQDSGCCAETLEKAPRSSSNPGKNAAKEAAARVGLLLEAADCLQPPPPRSAKKQAGTSPDREADAQQNDYVAELLLLLEESYLPCPLQEQLYAEVLQYLSSPAVSLAQWKQVVWQEAQQRQQARQVLLRRELLRKQEEKEPREQQGWPSGQTRESSDAGKQSAQESRLPGTTPAKGDNKIPSGRTTRNLERQNRRSRKRRPVTVRPSRGGRTLATPSATNAVYARSQGERTSQGPGGCMKGGSVSSST